MARASDQDMWQERGVVAQDEDVAGAGRYILSFFLSSRLLLLDSRLNSGAPSLVAGGSIASSFRTFILTPLPPVCQPASASK